MKPIRLEMTAFGPFAGKEVIDFQEMEREPVFLICGPTGAGKTMIFDAVSYALFGEASGEERRPEELRSDFAEEDILTEVELIFEVRGQGYRIRRQPRQIRRKKAGEGVTETAAKAELSYTDANGQIWAFTRLAEINEKIKEILGLGADQFKQIMMLPQGEFRKLLTADSKEREAILRELFDAKRYLALQLGLKQTSDQLEKEIREGRSIQKQWILQLQADSEEAAELSELLSKEEIDRQELFAAVERQKAADLLRAEERKENIEKLSERIDQKKELLFRMQRENESLLELLQVRAKLEGLEARAGEIKGQEAAIEQIQRAILLKPYAENYEKLCKQAGQAEEELKQKQKQHQAAEKEKAEQEDNYQSLKSPERQAELAEKEKSLQALKQQLPLLYSLIERKKGYGRLKREAEEKDRELKALLIRKTQLQDREKQLRQILQETEQCEAAQAIMDQKLKRLLKIHEIWQKEQHCRKEQLENAKIEQGLQKLMEEAEERCQKALQCIQEDHVWALRRSLKDGEHCPVCLGVYHTLATEKERLPEAVNLEEAERLREKLGREKEAASLRTAELNARRQAFVEQLLEETQTESMAEVERFLAKAEAEREADERLAEEYEKQLLRRKQAQQEQMQLERTSEQLWRQEQELTAECGKKQAELNEAAGEGKALKERLLPEYREQANPDAAERLAAVMAELEAEKNVWQEKLEAGERAYRQSLILYAQTETAKVESEKRSRELMQQQKQAEKEFQEKRRILGFETEQDWRYYSEKEGQKEKLTGEIKAYYEEWLKNVNLEKHLQQEVAIREPHKTEQTEQEEKLLQEERAAESEKRVLLLRQIAENDRIVRELRKMESRLQAQREKYAEIAGLAKAANGDNAKKLTFERYVLAVFLEDVLSAANQRLAKMTGRYTLKRKEEVTHRGRQSGLEIEVFDAFTGKTRNVNTLSGGEGFKAALAMALGLSEVISVYAGGIELDMLFIDEGFGTLDPDSLDSAIDCIMDLQTKGKITGIISHVAELKERIPAKLEVVQTPRGSRTEYRVGTAVESR